MTTGELGRVVSSIKHSKSDRPKLQKPTKPQTSSDTHTLSESSQNNNMKSLESMLVEQNTDIDVVLQENLDEEEDQTLDRHLLEAQLLKRIAARKRAKKQEQSESNLSIYPSTTTQLLPESVVIASSPQQLCTARSKSPIREAPVENDPPNT